MVMGSLVAGIGPVWGTITDLNTGQEYGFIGFGGGLTLGTSVTWSAGVPREGWTGGVEFSFIGSVGLQSPAGSADELKNMLSVGLSGGVGPKIGIQTYAINITPKVQVIEPKYGEPGFVPAKDIRGCFITGTKVLTTEGIKNIENLNIDDIVLSYNTNNNTTTNAKIIQCFRKQVTSYYKVTFEKQILYVTEEHPFYVSEKGWVRVKDLIADEYILSIDNKKHKIENISLIKGSIAVYNIRVDNFNNYFVTPIGLLVHNK